jgi:hypothetical protein
MRDPFRFILVILALCTIAAAGCQSAMHPVERHGTALGEGAVVRSLVTVVDAEVVPDFWAGWESSRNDPPLRAQVTPDHSWASFIEVRHREHLRTSGGRPREHTVTRTQTIQRRGERR